MIGVLEQSVSPSVWMNSRPPIPPPSIPGAAGGVAVPPSTGSTPLDAMDEEPEEVLEDSTNSIAGPDTVTVGGTPARKPMTSSRCMRANGNGGARSLPTSNSNSNGGPASSDDDAMDVDDDEVIVEADDDHIREMRERKRTLSIKLRETVEAFKRNNLSSNGWSSSSGESNGFSGTPPGRNPKLSCKMPSTDSAVGSSAGENGSRRESLSANGTEARREYVRSRRQTITNKFPNDRRPRFSTSQGQQTANSQRKCSNDSQFVDDFDFDQDEEMPAPVGYSRRRFSVPEKAFRNDFAIFRHKDRGLQCLGIFSRKDEPFKHFMQSLTCYDVAPSHSAVCVVDSNLTVRKSVIAYCTTGLSAALVINTKGDDAFDILTVTDCLQIFRIVSGNPELAEMKLRDFYDTEMAGRKKIIYANSNQSVWDVARMFRMNRVHRIPIVHSDNGKFVYDQENLMYFLSLRRIFSEVIFKLLESKCAGILTPNLHQMTLKDTHLGTWENIATVPEETPCGEVIDILLERRISCLALLDSNGFINGVVTKQDIMNTVAENRDAPFAETLRIPASKMISDSCLNYLVSDACTVEGAMRTLFDSNMPCLFIVDPAGESIQGVVSYADIMDFLLRLIETTPVRAKLHSSS